MPWVSDEVIALYRTMDASLRTISNDVSEIAREMRRLERRVNDMSKSTAEVVAEVREIRGFVASLQASQEALRQQVASALKSGDVDGEVVAEVDGLFEEAKAAAGSLAPAIVANPTPTDPVPTP